MQIIPIPAFIVLQCHSGFTASFSAVVAHDAAPAVIGEIRAAGADGPVSLVGGDTVDAPGDQGGLFTLATSGSKIEILFDRKGLGDAFAEGESVSTAASIPVTDGVSVTQARVVATVRRSLAAPVLLGPIPDQMDIMQ
ncbi:hypothetical protein [Pikeienuella sp. HZG-20]|uniref:hypothetical protein n=1 Tax=Paludibacillus litoralis TaxID=3133267 RepID=UPI0030EC3356